jgi:hypothetical protein
VGKLASMATTYNLKVVIVDTKRYLTSAAIGIVSNVAIQNSFFHCFVSALFYQKAHV